MVGQLRWVGHVVRMDDNRIPKQIFNGQWSSGKRPHCGPLRRYKDIVKVNMKRCGLQPKSLSTAALDRAQWRTTCQSAIAAFEETRVAELDRKRAAPKQQGVNMTGTAWPCDRCITYWALRPSAYPSVTQSVDIDGALHVCEPRLNEEAVLPKGLTDVSGIITFPERRFPENFYKLILM